MLKIAVKFDANKLTSLMRRALGMWNVNVNINDSVRIGVDEKTRKASANVNVRSGNKTVTIYIGHEAVVAGITAAAAQEGNLIDPKSLVFSYIPGSGYGGGSSYSAEANPSATAPEPLVNEPGKAKFPGAITIYFGTDELKDILKSGAERQGARVTYTTLYYTEGRGAEANISVTLPGNTTGSVSLKGEEVDEAISEELTARGYTVAAGGIKYSQTASSFGSKGGTSASVVLTAIPS